MAHWTALKNILKYLQKLKDMILVFGVKDELKVNCYSDASFHTYLDNSYSQSGWVFLLTGVVVTWKNSKQ